MKPTGCPVASKAAIPASPLVAVPSHAFPRKSDLPELLLDRFGGSRRIGDEDDRPTLPSPLQQPFGGAGIKVHAVVNHAPDIAKDQPVSLRQRIEKAHSSPASIRACSIGSTSSGIVQLPERKRRGFDIDHRHRHSGVEEPKLLEPLEHLSSLTGVAT